MSNLTSNEKSEVYMYLYRQTGLSRDQVWKGVNKYGYKAVFKKAAKKYQFDKDFDEVVGRAD